jgi:hypothetical protein
MRIWTELHNTSSSPSSEIKWRVDRWKSMDVSEDQVPSIFSTEVLLPASCCFLISLSLHHWRWKRHVPLKQRLIFSGLHGIIAQITELFVTTVARISYPTSLGWSSKGDRTGGTFSTHVWKNTYKTAVVKPKEKYLLKHLGVNGKNKTDLTVMAYYRCTLSEKNIVTWRLIVRIVEPE